MYSDGCEMHFDTLTLTHVWVFQPKIKSSSPSLSIRLNNISVNKVAQPHLSSIKHFGNNFLCTHLKWETRRQQRARAYIIHFQLNHLRLSFWTEWTKQKKNDAPKLWVQRLLARPKRDAYLSSIVASASRKRNRWSNIELRVMNGVSKINIDINSRRSFVILGVHNTQRRALHCERTRRNCRLAIQIHTFAQPFWHIDSKCERCIWRRLIYHSFQQIGMCEFCRARIVGQNSLWRETTANTYATIRVRSSTKKKGQKTKKKERKEEEEEEHKPRNRNLIWVNV